MARPSGHPLSPKAFGDALRWTGLSLTEVAERSGIPRATVSSLLGGFHRASVPNCHRLAATIGCDPETLFPTLRASVFMAVAA